VGPQAANPNSPEAPAAQCGPLLASSPAGPEDWVSAGAASAGGCPGQRRAGGGHSGGACLAGTPLPGPEKTQAGSRQATEAEKGLGQQGREEHCTKVLGQKDFTLAVSPFLHPEGQAGGPSPLAGFTLENPDPARSQPGALWP
jgi:hypothetical protein